MRTYIFILFALFLFISCGNLKNNKTAHNTGTDSEANFTGDTFFEEAETEKKLITEGSISYEVKDILASRQKILIAVEKYKGYVSSEQESNNDYNVSIDLTIRIPADSLNSFLSEATADVKKFDYKSINSVDVTDQYLDLSSRIRSNKELESRYLEILKKANDVDELLQVEKELGRIRSEIESQEGRLNLMNNKISYSTLSIHLYKKLSTPIAYGEQFKSGFKNGWKNLIRFIIGIINLWPFLIIILAGIILIRRLRKNKN